MVASGEVRLRVLAFGQHRSEETLRRWRAVGYIMSNLIGLEIEPQIFRMDSDIFKTTLRQSGLMKNYYSLNVKNLN